MNQLAIKENACRASLLTTDAGQLRFTHWKRCPMHICDDVLTLYWEKRIVNVTKTALLACTQKTHLHGLLSGDFHNC